MRRPSRTRAGLTAVLALLPVLLTGCGLFGGDDPAPSPSPSAAADPKALLDKARATLDGAQSAAFRLTSADVPQTGAALVGGTGDLARPDGFRGTLDVTIAGNLAKVEVVSVGGDFYAQLPFTSAFSKVDPKALGFTDPGTFMDPRTGLSQLLSQARDPVLGEETRIGPDVVREVRATLPGSLVADLLVSADPTQDVAATFAVTTSGDQLRQAVLVGPFYAKDTKSTFTLRLTDYGKSVDITPPA